MIKIEMDETKSSIEVLLDAQGIEELIGYLNFIKSRDDSIHLTAGNELSEDVSHQENKVIRHAKLIYVS